MPVYRIFCDKCGLDTYINNDFKPNKCPKCGEVVEFMSMLENHETGNNNPPYDPCKELDDFDDSNTW